MGKRLVDLSISVESGLPSDPPITVPEVTYSDHMEGASSMTEFFAGIDPSRDLPGGLGWAVESVKLSTHSGTHLDAPWHYHPTMDNGLPSLTIDQVPLEWCMGNGVVLDFRGFEDGYLVTAADMEGAFEKLEYELEPVDIVLVNTGASAWWGREEYLLKGCGMGREATLWLTGRGVRVVGTDAWSWDRPLSLISKEFEQSHDPSIIWEGHFAGIERGYCHIEKLTNLEALPPTGFTFFCFPVKIKNASAGWIRAVALVDEL